MFDEVDFSNLRKAVCGDSIKHLASCRNNSPDSDIYGIGLCPDNDVLSYYAMGSSEVGYEHEDDRYLVTEWQFEQDFSLQGNQELTKVWKQFDKITVSVPDDDQRSVYVDFRKLCLSAMVAGLSDFRSSEKLPDDFALLVYIPDPDFPDEIVAMAKKLNTPSVFQSFHENYMYA